VTTAGSRLRRRPAAPQADPLTPAPDAASLGASAQVLADEVALVWRPSRHAARLLTLVVAALLLGLLTRNAAVAAVAGPPLLLLGLSRLGLGRGEAGHPQDGPREAAPPDAGHPEAGRPGAGRARAVAVRVGLTSARIYEGEPVAVDVSLGDGADAGADDSAYDGRWTFEPGRGIEPGSAAAVNGPAARFAFAVPRWGKRPVGTVTLTLHDRWRLAEARVTVTLPSVDCYPAPAVQRQEVVLARLPNRLGEHRARVPGDGTEFNGIREFVPGDRQRAINWPASTRRGRLQVNTFAAERSQDVVLLVDATSDVGEPGSSALDLGLRGAAGAARAYLNARDRVGVISYQWGGAHWLAPSLGRRQLYKIIDTLLGADSGYARGAVFSRLPRAALPPGSLVVAFSPLLDGRFVEALRDMRERGFALIVVDVLNVTPPARRRFADSVAAKVWRMEQQAIRFSLSELGIPVVRWDGLAPLDIPLAPYTRRPLVTRR
jgi:uncharacterized protein (DUF58 family)